MSFVEFSEWFSIAGLSIAVVPMLGACWFVNETSRIRAGCDPRPEPRWVRVVCRLAGIR